jgi:phospholipid/cholesterol/gamma-HCH transport system substrate-binding protein
MEQKRLETKVGLFVFLGLALLALLIIQFSKGTSLFRGTYELRLHATTVGGLKPRASVLLAGVPVGSVSDIQLTPDSKSVNILLKIYKEVKIYSDAQFVIETSGFLGDQYVAVVPMENQGEVLTNDALVECQPPFNFQEVARSASGIIERIDDTARKLYTSISQLQQMVLTRQTMTNFSEAVQNLRVLTEQARVTMTGVSAIVATNGPEVNLAISNLLYFSAELTRIADSADAVMATNGPEINDAVKNIDSSTKTLNQLMAGLQSGKGLAGTVLQDQQLATNVQAIANNLDVASSNLNRFGLWHFLWHKEVPPPAPAPHEPVTHP